MSPENLQRVVQALRNASVLVAAHVDGAEHAFAARQLQLSIALMLNELASESRREVQRGLASSAPKSPGSARPETDGNDTRTKQAVEA